ncbi:hypothetical protein WME98_02120 [Sorangium sp. So ce296]|uniref:hypothetical protein n=1 Tax=Sorangium sp. So ce296 TaxID=3133296 RepID=UPI003F645190
MDGAISMLPGHLEANGRTETWISDRTGHKSSRQIHRYKRAARKVAELGLGDFAPLDEALSFPATAPLRPENPWRDF